MLCHTLDWSEKKPKETPDTKKSEHNKETMGSRKEEVSQDTLQMQAGSRQPWIQPRRCSRRKSKMRNAGPLAIWVTILLIFFLLKKYCCGAVSGSGYLWRGKKKPPKPTPYVSQKTRSSRVTPKRLCLDSREQQAGKGCQKQGSSTVGSIRTLGHCTPNVPLLWVTPQGLGTWSPPLPWEPQLGK